MSSNASISLTIAPGRFGGCLCTVGVPATRFKRGLKGKETILAGGVFNPDKKFLSHGSCD